jgi:hypothetical protein
MIKPSDSVIIQSVEPLLNRLRGEGQAEVGVLEKTCLIRIPDISMLTPEFLVGLLKLQDSLPVESFVVDAGPTAGCLEVSGGGMTIIKAFSDYRMLFDQTYKILDGAT